MRKTAIWCLIAFGVAPTMSAVAQPAVYPSRNITMVIPIGPGNAIDNMMRAMTGPLSQRLGQPVIIESKPGGGMSIGATFTANAPPDGHTLLVAPTGVFAINPSFFKKLSYNPETDFVPVALFAENAFVLVANPDLPVKSVEELIKYSKANPGKLTLGGGTLGGMVHLTAELLKKEVDMVIVPYKGGTPAALNDAIAGHVSMALAELSLAPAFIESGKLRPLAVSSAQRLAILPNVPTFSEAGLTGLVSTSWTMMVAPAKTPMPVVERLHAEMKEIVKMPEVIQHMNRIGFTPVDSPSIDEMRAFIKAENERWGKVVRDTGLAASE